MKRTTDKEELLSFAESAENTGTTWIQQDDYAGEEPIMTDEDLSGREPLQRLRLIVEAGGQIKSFETLFSTAAELEELMGELEPIFEKHPKQVLSADGMDEKLHGVSN
ncbi:hypothetical protein [Sporosarcina sp. P33]|uniref:hypothetical protein n=1 Tax=Sporosarcina sp. P33 TaxID=1930764 RepID=UPI0009BF9491|nr:hypothetical protein [Sporosarcina sp. P33]ARD47766.1 hypothetical protein SporoP33_05705 [Sporosarcina sp. P33]